MRSPNPFSASNTEAWSAHKSQEPKGSHKKKRFAVVIPSFLSIIPFPLWLYFVGIGAEPSLTLGFTFLQFNISLMACECSDIDVENKFESIIQHKYFSIALGTIVIGGSLWATRQFAPLHFSLFCLGFVVVYLQSSLALWLRPRTPHIRAIWGSPFTFNVYKTKAYSITSMIVGLVTAALYLGAVGVLPIPPIFSRFYYYCLIPFVFLLGWPVFLLCWQILRRVFHSDGGYVNATGFEFLNQLPEFRPNFYTDPVNKVDEECESACTALLSMERTNVMLAERIKTDNERHSLRQDLTRLERWLTEKISFFTHNQKIQRAARYQQALECVGLQRSMLDGYRPPITRTERFAFVEIKDGQAEIVRDENGDVLELHIMYPPGEYRLSGELNGEDIPTTSFEVMRPTWRSYNFKEKGFVVTVGRLVIEETISLKREVLPLGLRPSA